MPAPIPASDRLRKFLGDLYTGEVLGPTERAIQNVMEPVGKFFTGLKNPLDPQTGLPNIDLAGPVMTGITGARNAKTIIEKVMASKPASAAEAAVQYLKLKYPKLTQLPKDLEVRARPLFDFFGSNLGAMDPKTGVATVYDQSINRPMSSYVDTAAHETEHAKQLFRDQRVPEMTMPNEKIPGSEEFGKYYQGNLPADFPMKNIKDQELKDILTRHAYQMYKEQPIEVGARASGDVAEKTFKKFENYFKTPDTKPFDIRQPLTKEIFQDVLQDAVMKEWYNKVSVPERYPRQHEMASNHLRHVLKSASEHLNKIKNNEKIYWQFKPSDYIWSNVPELQEILKNKGYTSIVDKILNEEKIIPLTKSIEEIMGLPRPR